MPSTPVPQSAFVHLHTHSEYSLLDGAARLDLLVKRAAELEMPALALTDHGVMYGAVDFYAACTAAGIKPIIGVEAYLAPQGRQSRPAGNGEAHHHVTLLAASMEGYRNLLQLTTLASLEGFYRKPRIDHELLERHRGGILVLSGCVSGELSAALLQDNLRGAMEAAGRYRDMLGPDHYFLELQNHGLARQHRINEGLRRLARELGLQTVCTNDVHYLTRDDAFAHEVLLCIGTGKTMEDEDRLRYEGDQYYLKSAAEMAAAFPEDPDAVRRTLEIAERCDLRMEFGRTDLPQPDIPRGMTAQEYLVQLARDGLRRRVPHVTPDHERRLSHELEVIERTGFAEYILIVRDFAAFARRQGIHFGVRGSAAGSLVSYCVEITDVDPVYYDLTFERFLNPERAEMPDIDMDFEDTRRAEVLEYVTARYGRDHVAQIATFGTLQPRQVLKDVGKALGMSVAQTDRLAALIPAQGGHITLEEALDSVADLRRLYETDVRVRQVVDVGRRLQGIARHSSVHAAGVVISKAPLVHHTPLQRTSDGAVQTQYPAPALAKIGLLKMDFLGLINLSILSRSIEYIRRFRGVDIQLDALPLEDVKTFELLGRGETVGVFQLESSGMRRYIAALKPTSVQDLAAMVALYRPGPLDKIPEFIAAKHGRAEVRYLHPRLEPLLSETYGVIVYQDQVLTVVRDIGGFTMGQADLFRRAISKKHEDDIERMHGQFVAGAEAQGISREVAEAIYEQIKPFARYGFNKAHAVCYALVAYRTAYLKAHYPVEYMAALLACYADKTDKLNTALAECKRMGVRVVGPDVNASECDFVPAGEAIRFGLADIKNVGRAFAEAIVEERSARGHFTSLNDFCRRLQGRTALTRTALEALIRCGAFDGLHANRRALLQVLPQVQAMSGATPRRGSPAGAGLFDIEEEGLASSVLIEPPAVADFPPQERARYERELLGVFLSVHPLEAYPDLVADAAITKAAELPDVEDGAQVTMAGFVTDVRERSTRRKQPMAYVTLEDMTGSASLTCFPRVFEAHRAYLAKNQILRIVGRATSRDMDRDGESQRAVEVIVESVEPVMTRPEREAVVRELHLRIRPDCADRLKLVRRLLGDHPGDCPVYVHVEDEQGSARLRSRLRVRIGPELLGPLLHVLGTGGAWVTEK